MIQEAIAPQVLLIPQKKEINFHGIQIKFFWPSLDLRSKSLLKSPELRQIPKKSAHDESFGRYSAKWPFWTTVYCQENVPKQLIISMLQIDD